MTQQLHVPQQTMLPPQPTTHMAPQMPPPYQRPPRRPINAAAVAKVVFYVATFSIAVAALIVALSRPSSPPAQNAGAPTYSPSEIAAAKTKACTAADRSAAGLRVATHRPGPTASDDALGWANNANARVALLTAATYLPRQVDPATPDDIRDSIGVLSTAASDALSVAVSDGQVAGGAETYDKAIDTMNVASKEITRYCNAG